MIESAGASMRTSTASLAALAQWSPLLAHVIAQYAGAASLVVQAREWRRLHDHVFVSCLLDARDFALFDPFPPEHREIICQELRRLVHESLHRYQREREQALRQQAQAWKLCLDLLGAQRCQEVIALAHWGHHALRDTALVERLVDKHLNLQTPENIYRFVDCCEERLAAFRKDVLRCKAYQQAHADHRRGDLGDTHGVREAYALLGLPCSASWSSVRQRFRELALEHHPDRGGDGMVMQEINRAYTLLRERLER
ncbi:MAG: J domain-containing protein [Chloroflexi bacterium]|nr:J domain-containing protein [Chloroflexota bacterium]